MQKCYIAKERKKKKSMCFQRETAADCTTSSAMHEAWSTNLRTSAFWFDFFKNAVLDTARCAKLRAVNSTSRSSKTRSGVPLCGGERVKQSVILKSHVGFFFVFFFIPREAGDVAGYPWGVWVTPRTSGPWEVPRSAKDTSQSQNGTEASRLETGEGGWGERGGKKPNNSNPKAEI